MSINCSRSEVVNSLGGKNVIVRLNVNHVKLTCGSYIRSNENTVSGRTLRTVTRNGTHLKILFTNTLGDKRGGSTAVTVSSPLTAKCEHCLAFLVRAETNRVISSTAVIHTNNESTVGLYTNHRTSSIVVTTLLSGINKLAILNYHTKGYTNSMEKGSICQVLFNLCLVVRLNVTRNVTLCILEYIKDRRCCVKNSTTSSYILMRITDPLTVVNKYTGGVGVIIKVCVHTTDNVVSECILVILSHFGEFLMRPVSLIFQILIDLVVSGNDGYIGVRRVYLNNVKNLSTITGCVVKYDLGLNSRAGNEYVILL